MRTLIPNILTPDLADELSRICPNKSNTIWDRPEINELIEKIFLLSGTQGKPLLEKPSYWRVEKKHECGHKWHYDGCKEQNGKLTKNHMPWCTHTCSILLSDPATYGGGTFKFKDPDEEYREEHYLSAVFFTSHAENEPQLHMVERDFGPRTALLMFLKVLDEPQT